jgi:hypothetical protein
LLSQTVCYCRTRSRQQEPHLVGRGYDAGSPFSFR